MSQNPYVIYGVIRKNGQIQIGVDVTIKNVTKNEQFTVQTDSEGEYAVDLADTSKFPSGYSNGDQVQVSSLNVVRTTTVNTVNYGERIDFYVGSALDFAVGVESCILQGTIPVVESGLGLEELSLQGNITVADNGVGSELFGKSFMVVDGGNGDETAFLQGQVTIQDSGIGNETFNLTLKILEVATTLETVAIQAVINIQDSGWGVGNGIIKQATLTIVDYGSGNETVTILTPTFKQVFDSAVGSDTPIIKNTVTIYDSAIGLETAVPTGKPVIIDVGNANEYISISTQLSLNDVGQGLDLTNIITENLKLVTDKAVGVDTPIITSQLLLGDVGHGSETINLLGMEFGKIKITVSKFIPLKIETLSFTPLKIEARKNP